LIEAVKNSRFACAYSSATKNIAFFILSLTYRYIIEIQIAENEIPMYRSYSFKRMPAKKDQRKKVKPAAKK
jgi:hypothetical protein